MSAYWPFLIVREFKGGKYRQKMFCKSAVNTPENCTENQNVQLICTRSMSLSANLPHNFEWFVEV